MAPETTTRETDTRERILAAGAELIAKQGFNGTGISEVLQLAGVPKGSFYHYFASKEDFGVALIERTCDGYLEELKPVLNDRKLKPLTRLRRIFETANEQCAASGPSEQCLISKIALETASLSEPVHAAVRCAYQQWSALLARVIREGQAAREIDRKHDADRLGNVLVMLWEGASMRAQIDRDTAAFDDFLFFVFDTLLNRPR
jgi:TetR/AcrR family transcriptional repressor of nem operon